MVTSIIQINTERIKIHEVAEELIETETMLAFQAFSKHNLGTMFSIGVQ